MMLAVFWYDDLKNSVFFLEILKFSQCFGDSKFRLFFSKIRFSIKLSSNLLTYSNYGCLQLKSSKFAISASGNSAKTVKFGKIYIHTTLPEDAVEYW